MSISITAQVARLGKNVFFFPTDQTGLLWTPTAVNTNPTLYINGSEVTNLQGPYPLPSSGFDDFTLFRIPSGVKSTDIVTYSGVSDWLSTSAGNAPAVTNALIGNYVGQLEPGVGKYNLNGGLVSVAGFNIPNSQRKMTLGYVASVAQESVGDLFSLAKNWVHRGYWVNVLTSNSYGIPLTISSATYLQFTSTTAGNLVDSRGVPTLTGTYAFIWDETNPSASMQPSISIYAPGYATIVSQSGRIPGIINESGVEVGVTFIFTVAYSSQNPSSWPIELYIEFASHSGTYPSNFTIQNFYIINPLANSGSPNISQPSTRTDPYATAGSSPVIVPGTFIMDGNLKSWLTTPSGLGPGVMRYMDCTLDFDGLSALNDVGDQQNQYNSDWLGGSRNIEISQIRNYNVTDSPYVWFAKQFGNTPATAGGPLPYASSPTDPGYLNWGGLNTQWYVGEIVTTVPHNLKNGRMNLSGSGLDSITLTNGPDATVTTNLNGALSVKFFVTSSTTIAFTGYCGTFTAGSGNTLPGAINNVSGTQNIAAGSYIQVSVPDPGANPYEVTGAVTSVFPGCAHIVNIPVDATNDLITAIAESIFNSTSPNAKIIPEYGNEDWSGTANIIACFAMGALNVLGLGANDSFHFQVERAAQMCGIFQTIWVNGGRNASDIIWTISSQFSDNGLIEYQMEIINAYNNSSPSVQFPLQAVFIAPYEACQSDSQLQVAAGSVYHDQPDSIGYEVEYPWTRGDWIEYLRFDLTYSDPYNKIYYGGLYEALATYTPIAGQPKGFVPEFWCYEFGYQQVSPNISNSNFDLNYYFTHDILYDPDIIHLYDAYFIALQTAGATLACYFNICDTLQTNGYGYNWGMYKWPGQDFGYGDGSDGKYINEFWQNNGQCNDQYNVSVAGQAWQNWVNAQASSGIPPRVLQITAGGMTQATATILPFYSDPVAFVVGTVPSGSGVILQPASAPNMFLVINEGNNSLNIYPPFGGTINQGSVNSPISLSPNSKISIWAIHSTTTIINFESY